ncbi:c-type cytochrome [Roseomonas fluvialis]|uniref:Cytochrome c n=1 Tax=Roseomonas fluvialis TaxID=1750527 RepID=A0ABM7Y822_9PROT|nr:cytochrome c [Roseomonas fluvialis]BDG74139.1 cytochrome c [Roseomonas fluvialis]
MTTIASRGLRAAAMIASLAAAPALAQQAAPSGPNARGEYLSRIMDCGGCHTGGALAGRPDPRLHLAGSGIGFGIPEVGVFYPPNLTPDRETGLGTWSEADIVRAVRTGVRPDGRVLAPVMPWHSYAALTDADARALARYLRALPPVRNPTPAMVGATETPTAPYLTVVVPGAPAR